MSDYADEDDHDAYYSDDAMDIDGDDDELSVNMNGMGGKGKNPEWQIPYKSLSTEDLRGLIDGEVNEIVSLLGVSHDLALILLLHFRWNRDRLIDKYTDAPKSILREAGEPLELEETNGITHPTTPRPSSLKPPPPSQTKSPKISLRKPSTLLPLRKRARHSDAAPPAPKAASSTRDPELDANVCGVCFDTITDGVSENASDADATMGLSMRCKHKFCIDCWRSYLTGKVRDEAQCSVRCMGAKCPTTVEETFLREVLGENSAILQRYHTLLAESYVGARTAYRFCPFPSCDAVLHCPTVPRESSMLSNCVPTVLCCGQSKGSASPVNGRGRGRGNANTLSENNGGHTSCFGCGLVGGHRPVICKIADLWLGAAREDSGTAQWIKANTRTCPKCNNNIEKAGGCNRMVCRHCKFQFCWMCMKSWDVHGYNDSVCNAFVEPPRTTTMDEAKANLERWMFYYDRFNNHELSAKLESELVKRTEEKMTEIQEASDLTWIEAQFMQEAVGELSSCRQTLKWTYAMAHFLSKGNKKHIFEDIQADLEKAVEQLSQMLDEPIEEETVLELRKKVMDKTVYVLKRHEVVLEDVAKGLLEGSWEWTVEL